MRYEELVEKRKVLLADMDQDAAEAKCGLEETRKLYHVAIHTREILDDLDQQFKEKTRLTDEDIAFLFIAVGLQVMRQYLLTRFPKIMDDKTAAKRTPGHLEEHSDRHHRLYNPSLAEIITNPVPFDAMVGADGALKGGGKMGHRVTAIGHDPLLGLIFGTANIATSTLTTSSLASYHIYTNAQNVDYFRSKARTELVIGKTINKALYEGYEGKAIVAASLAKEIIHLHSDLYTKNSLPLPVIPVLNSELAGRLGSYGLHMANVLAVGKQAAGAALINFLIATAHRLYGGNLQGWEAKFYEVRTRNIVSYSNAIAMGSNLVATAVTRDIRLLDIGGFAVTVYRLITDRKFIRSVKEEFIFGQYFDMVRGEERR
ncbi:hypothetical protein [Lachnoclostridium sp. An118]|uniref:hypothetical protein n=1 Tax=Lachnoclostridium sp. An118 TaxID=1965547 RepID=UPI000B3747B7|nr:hypothetical protein [Lachnoclostridium sp. An118]OUQ50184.1 hypothetical protein B5E62_08850 [Lachnoclostridium sp. An118]